jgi:methyl-accepting chemotaxis protein
MSLSFLGRVKIVHKILFLLVLSLVVISFFNVSAIYSSNKELKTLKAIHDNNIIPLDGLRNLQIIFRDIEYRMVAVMAEIYAPLGGKANLEESLPKLDRVWKETKEGLNHKDCPCLKDIKLLESELKAFKDLSKSLHAAYASNELDDVSDVFDEWLDLKAGIFKTTDSLAEHIENTAVGYIENKKMAVARKNRVLTLFAIVLSALFLLISITIILSIRKPINKLLGSMGLIANGDLTQNVDITTNDEIGGICRGLNKMTDTLRVAFNKVSEGTMTLSEYANILTTSSSEMLKAANDQLAQIEQIAASTTQTSESVLDVAKNASDASEATKKSSAVATEGNEIVNKSIESIKKLSSSVLHTSDTITELGGRSNEIGDIVSVIEDIADQTNLLALNAAIEAARAGEQGRGFAVVADEVRKLAERTSGATGEITEKISAIQSNIDNSISIMEGGKAMADEAVNTATEAGRKLTEIVESSNVIVDVVHRIATSTEEQSAASEEVSQNMEQISAILSNTNKLSQNVQQTAFDLASLSEVISEHIRYFKTSE